MNIYLDIDGVLLINGQPSPHVYEFLKYITDRFSTYWLTTHCKGDSKVTVSYASYFFDQSVIGLLKKIKPTNWDLSKTEAIDYNSPFLWFDDYIFSVERKDLIKHKALNSWVEVNLSKNKDQLKDVISNLAH